MGGKFEILGESKWEPPFLEKDLPESPITVAEAFATHTELGEIGTLEQYTIYLENIFPDSKIKQLLYHSSTKRITDSPRAINPGESGETLYGFYMADRPVIYGEHVTVLKVNALHVKEVDALTVVRFDENDYEILKKEGVDLVYAKRTKNQGEYDYSEIVVFDVANLHVLGSTEDADKFRQWVQSTQKT